MKEKNWVAACLSLSTLRLPRSRAQRQLSQFARLVTRWLGSNRLSPELRARPARLLAGVGGALGHQSQPPMDRWIYGSGSFDQAADRLGSRFCRQAARKPQVKHPCTAAVALLAAVADGSGCNFLPPALGIRSVARLTQTGMGNPWGDTPTSFGRATESEAWATLAQSACSLESLRTRSKGTAPEMGGWLGSFELTTKEPSSWPGIKRQKQAVGPTVTGHGNLHGAPFGGPAPPRPRPSLRCATMTYPSIVRCPARAERRRA